MKPKKILPEERGFERREFDQFVADLAAKHHAGVEVKSRVVSSFAYMIVFPLGQSHTLTVGLELKDWQSDSDVTITNYVVSIPARDDGAGRKGIGILVEWAKSCGFNEIRATQVQKHSQGFWEKMGFVHCPGHNPTNDFLLTLP